MSTPNQKEDKVTELVIDRKTWFHGTMGSKLLRPDGKMCCLGFLSLAGGLKKEDILDVGMPSSVSHLLPQKLDCIRPDITKSDTDFAKSASILNDINLGYKIQYTGRMVPRFCGTIVDTQETKERLLTELFAEEGIALTFIN